MSAKKSMPSVLFYGADYLVGVIGMTWEEQGRYMYLLMIQQQKGHFDMLEVMPDVPEKVREKFVTDEDGLFYNERMEEEMRKRYKYSESRRNNRLSANNQENKNKLSTGKSVDKSSPPVDKSSCVKHMSNICTDICQTYEKHMDNDNDNDNNNDNNTSLKKCTKTSDIIEQAANGTAYEELDEQTKDNISKEVYEKTAKLLQ